MEPCSFCGRVRENSYNKIWFDRETREVDSQHAICPVCVEEIYNEMKAREDIKWREKRYDENRKMDDFNS